jgi:soluble lytic murein transglycosylase-like protein
MEEQRQQQTGLMRLYSCRVNANLIMGALSLCLFCSLTQAEIYKFKDKFGRIIFTDVPKTSEYVKVKLKGWSDPTRSMNPAYVRVNMEKYRLFVESAAEQYNLPLPLLHAVITVESAYNPQAVSRAGAMGLMQLMPDTAERFGVKNSFSPDENIRGGSRYLQHLMGLFKGDLNLVLAAYNAGEGAVMKYGNSIPPYAETQNYVRKVKQYQVIFSQQL